jgi:geranylgeranyl diphosphate synthase type II
MEFNNRKDVTIGEYLNMIDKKTARLLEVSAVIGGHCAEAEQKHINSLQKIARNAGMSFQLLDDILDITADQAKLGKKIGQDIIEGKKTFLIITAKNLASDKADIELMDEFYRNNGLPEEKVPDIKAVFEKYGVFDKAFAKSDEYLNEAKKHFGELPDNDYKEMLKWLIYSLADRKF